MENQAEPDVVQRLGTMDISREAGESGGHVLQAFAHLVGGHACVLRFDGTTICKPLLVRERQVYESLPTDIACFAPQYKGSVFLKVEERNGELCFVIYPQVDARGCGRQNGVADFSSEVPSAETGSDVCRRDFCVRIERLQKKFMDQNQHEFILLENLVTAYAAPCILDLKMGVRQYGDDAPDHKKALHTRTCQQSTSSILGVRISGMQMTSAGHSILPPESRKHNNVSTSSNDRASLPPPILSAFYRGTIESVLTSCITVSYGNCNASNHF